MENERSTRRADPEQETEVTTVLFDLDDTLCRPRPPFSDVLDDMFYRAGVDPFFDTSDYRRWVPEVDADGPEYLLERCFEAIAEEADRDPDVAHTLLDAYEEPDEVEYRFRKGAETALDALDERYTLGLVTNGSEQMQTPKLDSLGITDYFDTMVFATPEIGIKPDPGPFHRALDALDATSAGTVHIGNSRASDVGGASAAGIRSVWVPIEASPGDGPEPDFLVDSMHELTAPPWEAE